jgi:hypothetical protein
MSLLATCLPIVGVSLLWCAPVDAQARHNVRELPSYQTASAHGTLTVTATVVTSVGLVTGPNGDPILIVANAVDSSDNVSQLIVVEAPSTTIDVSKLNAHENKRQNGP